VKCSLASNFHQARSIKMIMNNSKVNLEQSDFIQYIDEGGLVRGTSDRMVSHVGEVYHETIERYPCAL